MFHALLLLLVDKFDHVNVTALRDEDCPTKYEITIGASEGLTKPYLTMLVKSNTINIKRWEHITLTPEENKQRQRLGAPSESHIWKATRDWKSRDVVEAYIIACEVLK